MVSATGPSSATHSQSQNLNLNIVGLGIEYPPFQVGSDALEIVAERFYPPSPALSRVLSINRFTGIETRSTIAQVDHPLVNQPNAPSISQLCDVFLNDGVSLAVKASRKALAEWGGHVDEITHVVSTTCTNSANPGFDHYVIKKLGINQSVDKVLLHGVGCAGGLAALRTAANLALANTFQRKPARILVLACELSSLLVRSELNSISENQEVRIGPALFSDCASAVILDNGVGEAPRRGPIYELVNWKHKILPDTTKDLGFDVHPLGWKVVLSHRVPSLAAASVAPTFAELLDSNPEYNQNGTALSPLDFDWALHPGGSTVITGVEKEMGLTAEHLRASYLVYMAHGNSSSATVFSVLDKLRKIGEGKEDVMGCAFGPGIAIEMIGLKRRNGGDLQNGDGLQNGDSRQHEDQPTANGSHEQTNGANGHYTNGTNGFTDETNGLPVESVD